MMKIARTALAALLLLVAATACDSIPTQPSDALTPVIGSGTGGG